ncbi:MAG TPA: hypothetical protein PLO33_09560, partial [Kouleothrix sp.]|nr:hypothetical protein [Kouleothrix sp.]
GAAKPPPNPHHVNRVIDTIYGARFCLRQSGIFSGYGAEILALCATFSAPCCRKQKEPISQATA